MLRLLLDTNAFLWWLWKSRELDDHARAAIADSRNNTYVSAISGLEIAIKRSRGKLQAPDDLDEAVRAQGFWPLPITLRHAEQAGYLPDVHRDPFDRLLVAQAQIEGMVIVTRDAVIPRYAVSTMKA